MHEKPLKPSFSLHVRAWDKKKWFLKYMILIEEWGSSIKKLVSLYQLSIYFIVSRAACSFSLAVSFKHLNKTCSSFYASFWLECVKYWPAEQRETIILHGIFTGIVHDVIFGLNHFLASRTVCFAATVAAASICRTGNRKKRKKSS